MATICREAEADVNYGELYPALRKQIQLPIGVAEAIASSAVKTAWDVHAAAIIVLTETGNTALKINKYRPIAPVLAVTASEVTARQCQILRGIYPYMTETMQGTENVLHKAMLYAVRMEMAYKDDKVLVTSGVLEETAGSTNIMKVVRCVGFEV